MVPDSQDAAFPQVTILKHQLFLMLRLVVVRSLLMLTVE